MAPRTRSVSAASSAESRSPTAPPNGERGGWSTLVSGVVTVAIGSMRFLGAGWSALVKDCELGTAAPPPATTVALVLRALLADRDRHVARLAAAQHARRHRRADRLGAERAAQVVKALHRLSADGQDDVADGQTGLACRAGLIDRDEQQPEFL